MNNNISHNFQCKGRLNVRYEHEHQNTVQAVKARVMHVETVWTQVFHFLVTFLVVPPTWLTLLQVSKTQMTWNRTLQSTAQWAEVSPYDIKEKPTSNAIEWADCSSCKILLYLSAEVLGTRLRRKWCWCNKRTLTARLCCSRTLFQDLLGSYNNLSFRTSWVVVAMV